MFPEVGRDDCTSTALRRDNLILSKPGGGRWGMKHSQGNMRSICPGRSKCALVQSACMADVPPTTADIDFVRDKGVIHRFGKKTFQEGAKEK